MKNHKKGIIAASMMLATASLSTNVFAENYGITYSGGDPLSDSNVTINPGLIDGLTPLFKSVIPEETTYSNSSKWEDGYMLIESYNICKPMKYFRVSGTKTIKPEDNLKMTLSNEKYSIDISFDEASIEGYVDDGKDFAVAMDNNWIDGMTEAYTDAECQNKVTDIKESGYSQNSKQFIKTNVKLRKKGTAPVFVSDELYFGIVDIDAAQSFKVLNPSNLLTKNNMFARAAADLQGDNPESEFKNIYVENGNYIYAEFNKDSNPPTVSSSNKSNVFVKLNQETQRNGLDIVFGFVAGAASRVDYYAKQYSVKYISDEGGDITGIPSEDVIAGQNPIGSEEEAKEDYVFKYWIADKDVTLTDNTTIKAGQPITMDKIKLVIVNQDITFTAIHEKKEATIPVPNTGASTMNIEPATIASVSVFGVLALALTIRVLPRFTRKKVRFE
ncbi:hypothetical protein IJG26_01465 [Candidatus Saccharibacteria bacterium]|nr:hypothetical protein [Candidatus Saccharibacteria bacterium]